MSLNDTLSSKEGKAWRMIIRFPDVQSSIRFISFQLVIWALHCDPVLVFRPRQLSIPLTSTPQLDVTPQAPPHATTVGLSGAWVETMTFNRGFVGSTPALAAIKSFTYSCLWRFGVKLRYSIRAVVGCAPDNFIIQIYLDYLFIYFLPPYDWHFDDLLESS